MNIYLSREGDDPITASFPPAFRDGTGKMVVEVRPLYNLTTNSQYFYRTSISIDSKVVYGPDNVSCVKIRGLSHRHTCMVLDAVHETLERHGMQYVKGDEISVAPDQIEQYGIWLLAHDESEREARRRAQFPEYRQQAKVSQGFAL